MKNLTFKRLSETAILPTRANASDAGLDLYANEGVALWNGESAIVGTGVAVAIPEGYYGRIAPRSGLAVRRIDVLGGVVDPGYTGEVKVILINHSIITNLQDILPGDRIAQLIIEKIETPEAVWGEIEETVRGADGFGSTGA